MDVVRKVVGVVTVLGMLAGCASSPPPTLQHHEYAGFATVWVGMHRCIEQGSFSPELGASGVGFLKSEIGAYAYNPQIMEAALRRKAEEIKAVPKEACSLLAVEIAENKRQVAIHNAVVDQDRQNVDSALEYVRNSQPVFCNKIGDVTLCN